MEIGISIFIGIWMIGAAIFAYHRIKKEYGACMDNGTNLEKFANKGKDKK